MNTIANATISDTSFTAFLQSYVENPIQILLLIVITWILYVFYKERGLVLALIKSLILIKTGKRNLTKEDLINHQLFNDLNFWIDSKINQLYTPECRLNEDKAKILIARDVLLIKLKNDREWITNLVASLNLDDEYLNLRSIFSHKIEKNMSIQYSEMLKAGIPKLFIAKFNEICRIHQSYLNKCMIDILSDKIPLNNYDKVHIVLSNFLAFFSTIINEMIYVVESINGDLKGVKYKNFTIGGNNYKVYPVPDKNYIPLVKTNLEQLANQVNADRTGIVVFHDIIEDNYLEGYFSNIYEYCANGIMSEILKMQYKPTYIFNKSISELKQHKMYVVDVDKQTNSIKELLCPRGTKIVAMYPIFHKDILRGIICAEYLNKYTYEEVKLEEIEESLKYYASLLNIYLDYSKKGLCYNNIDAELIDREA